MQEQLSTIGILKLIGYVGGAVFLESIGTSDAQFSIYAILMGVDIMTGLAKQYRLDPKKIMSNRLIVGVLSKAMTIIVVIALALAIIGTNNDPNLIIGLLMNILIINEIYSILGNYIALRTGEEVKEFDAVSITIKKFREIFKKYLMRITDE